MRKIRAPFRFPAHLFAVAWLAALVGCSAPRQATSDGSRAEEAGSTAPARDLEQTAETSRTAATAADAPPSRRVREDDDPIAEAGDAAATVGGDGSEIVLAPLSTDEVQAASLAGELACSFAVGDAPPLLVAMGDVASQAPSRGIVKVGSYVEAVAAPGGFDAMLKGATFAGAGKTLRIELTGQPSGDSESPPVPATLTYDRADGARRTFGGQWRCGP